MKSLSLREMLWNSTSASDGRTKDKTEIVVPAANARAPERMQSLLAAIRMTALILAPAAVLLAIMLAPDGLLEWRQSNELVQRNMQRELKRLVDTGASGARQLDESSDEYESRQRMVAGLCHDLNVTTRPGSR